MRIRFLLFWCLVSIYLLAEPSVYTGGGHNRGYNSSRSRVSNKSVTTKSIARLKQQISKLKEEIEGLRGVLRSLQTKG